MDIPKQLKICGYTYEVILEDRQNGRGINNTASCNTSLHKIWIDNNQCREEQESSLIHEILEAVNYHFNLALIHKDLATLETAFYQVLKDNNFLKE